MAFADQPSAAVDPGRFLAVGLGSTEQHGPHLPLSTDTVVARALVAHLCDVDPRFVAGPTLEVTASGEHAGFPGTLSIGTEVLTEVLLEIVRSARGSCAGVYLVSGHGGNATAIARAVARSTSEGDHVGTAPALLRNGDAHGGRTETSLLLHLAPHLVGEERPVGATEPLATLAPALRSGGVAAVSANGVLGDARGASVEEGRVLFAEMGGRLVEHASAWRGALRWSGE